MLIQNSSHFSVHPEFSKECEAESFIYSQRFFKIPHLAKKKTPGKNKSRLLKELPIVTERR